MHHKQRRISSSSHHTPHSPPSAREQARARAQR
jgi:hypothetical protein